MSWHSRIPASRTAIVAAVALALHATGEDIAAETRRNMYPGHFLLTGASQEGTAYEQTGALSGQVHIPTPYASAPEFGTVHMAPRPALQPAIDTCWPVDMIRHTVEEIRRIP